MVITTKENTVEIRLTTRSMAVFEEKFGIKDSIQFWKRAAAGPNVKILATALFTFSKEVSSLDDAFDLIDECRTEGKTIYELYEELIQEANGGGFFKKFYTVEELKEEMKAPALDLEQIVNSAVNTMAKDAIMGAV